MPFETIHANHRVAIFPSPMEADMAVLPNFTDGSPAYPNEYVEQLYGYNDNFLSHIGLTKGFMMAQAANKKSILYVLTKDGQTPPQELINQSLWFDNKRWLSSYITKHLKSIDNIYFHVYFLIINDCRLAFYISCQENPVHCNYPDFDDLRHLLNVLTPVWNLRDHFPLQCDQYVLVHSKRLRLNFTPGMTFRYRSGWSLRAKT